MRFFYNLFIWLYQWSITLASPFYEKARLWRNGRRNIFARLENAVAGKPIIWMHCASLGEYEQGKPLIEKLRKDFPASSLLVTFFSPSGYEVRKNDPAADFIFYLPMDTPRNARRFLEIVNPQAAIFVKYEYWFNYMRELKKRDIPFYYISAIFFAKQHFFKWYGRWFSKQLQQASHFYVQNMTSAALLQKINIRQVTISGDTRFDRVARIAQENASVPAIETFKSKKKLMICGSTWPPDEKLLADFFPHIQNEYKLVIAPHLIHQEHLNSITALFSNYKTAFFTQIGKDDLQDFDILIIDTIGLLNKMYKYGNVAYIGGGFETGLHNTLEAAVFGIPIFFGPHYEKFNEAIELVNRQAAFSISTLAEMQERWQEYVENAEQYAITCQRCRDYVTDNLGAVDKIKIDVKS